MAVDYNSPNTYRGSETLHHAHHYGYAWSKAQNELNEQRRMLLKEDVILPRIYTDLGGNSLAKRPGFQELREKLNPNDTLVITSLNCIATDLQSALVTLDVFAKNRISIKILDLGNFLVDARGHLTPNAELIRRTLMAATYLSNTEQAQRTLPSTKNVISLKRGRPRGSITPAKQHAYNLLRGKNGEQRHSYQVVSQMTGISVSTLQRTARQIENQ